jgi:CelD/BcsL family acetyltransferase involved in cellulose biosynthesis
MGQQSGTGIYHECLADELHSRAIRPWIYETYVRAFLRRAESDEAYLRSAVSGGKLKELRRLERRLADMGPLEFHALTPDGDLSAALDEFLELERSGWKGKQGTAIACRPADSAFFRAVAKNLFERGRLRLTFLGQAGKPLAAKCNLLAPPGSFAFKIAFSEQHQKFSPGV